MFYVRIEFGVLRQNQNLRVRSGVTNTNLTSGASSTTGGGAAAVPPPPPPPTAAAPPPPPLSSVQQQQQFPPFVPIGGGPLTLDYEMPYAHDNHHYSNNQHNGRSATGKKAANPDSYKTVMCQAWLESKMCAFGENCRFAHGEAELRPVRSVPCQINKYKTKLCDKYTTTGLCPYGDRCLFIHPDNGTNAYIRPDKLVEVSRRHALADMQFLASMDAARAVTPPNIGHLPASTASELAAGTVDVLQGEDGGVPHAQSGRAGDDDHSRERWASGSWDELSTPARSSSGYVSGGSTPSGSSPFSTVSSSSLHLNLTDDDRDFDIFNLTVGFDHIAQDLAKTLELW
ncbi:unnamed protein product [Heligmosomoides polygyrus]|uniref:C3H1-type domain-containing protein n=1 Tax=Heligmosomoides polygyrus TaxID=6339 RepID=A0A3P8B1S8_HELPZ|nr:unnamed protein product [Heligmosomoides polygyrus]